MAFPSLNIVRGLAQNVRDLDKVLINQGRMLAAGYSDKHFEQLQDAEFQIFSQWGEDGIIQYLTQNLKIEHKTFVEFGVETFREANCRFLMMKDFWAGMVIDGSAASIARIEQAQMYWRHALTAVEAFISRDNIAELIARAPFDGIGILSVDIDGVDYFILEALKDVRAAIVIVEYNGLFGATAKVSVPYSADFQRTKAHHSNLYYGASIAAFDHLLAPRGYALVGGNAAGNNAFFVRTDLLTDKIRPVSVGSAFRATSFAEGRDENGKLSFVRGMSRRAVVADLPLVDVATGQQLRVADLPAT
ncbi:MAG: hypothetical protein K2Y20_12895 [Sphingomonas sp.]|nr:hypothetical protein [Sphingomonas sp.]